MRMGYIGVYLDGRENKYRLNSKQLDTMRKIKVQVIDDNTIHDLSQYTKAEVKWLKADNKQVHNDCVIDGNVVEITLTQQMLAVSGIAKFEVILMNASGFITTGTTDVLINKSVHDDSNLDSTDEYDTFQNIVSRFEEIETKIDNAEQILEDCETIARNEETRLANESIRQSNETQRITNDIERATVTEECIIATDECKIATDRANASADACDEIVENKTGINDDKIGTITTWSSNKINTSLANQIGTASGASINLQNSFNGGLLLKELQGKSVQNGTPTPENKVDIVSVGDNGSVVVRVTGKNILNFGKPTGASTNTTYTYENDTLTITSKGSYNNISYDISHLRGETVSISYDGMTSTNDNAKPIIQLLTIKNGVNTYTKFNANGAYILIPSDVATVKLVIQSNNIATSLDNIFTLVRPQLVLGTTVSTYEPYKEQLITIPLTQPLRSVGVVYDRGCMKKDGLWGNERNISQVTFDGSADEIFYAFPAQASTDTLLFQILLTNLGVSRSAIISNHFITSTTDMWNTTYNNEALYVGGKTDSNGFYPRVDLRINKSRLATPDILGLRTWLQANPLTAHYALATPTFEPFSQSIQDQLNALQTYQGVTNMFTTDPQQPTMIVQYGKTDSSALALYAENVSDSKLDKSKSVNNLITTVEGTVLDGRQGKALSEKIGNLSDLKTEQKTDLVGAVNEVNNNLAAKKRTVLFEGTFSSGTRMIENINNFDEVIVYAGAGYFANQAIIIPVSEVAFGRSNQFAMGVFWSAETYWGIQFSFDSATVININGLTNATWLSPVISQIVGIKY